MHSDARYQTEFGSQQYHQQLNWVLSWPLLLMRLLQLCVVVWHQQVCQTVIKNLISMDMIIKLRIQILEFKLIYQSQFRRKQSLQQSFQYFP